jgi:hypothetical protein
MMRITIAVLFLLLVSTMYSQGNIDTLNFDGGVELAHYNYLNTSLSITEKEQGGFWARYEEMEKTQAEIKANLRSLKKSLLYGFMKSDEEIISIVQQIAELDMAKIKVKRDFIVDCVGLLDAERAIRFSLYEKEFKKKAKDFK